ncbi:ABC transporter permease [Stieleria sp. TO1_6]|uniref:ABC transporter permease subunit n=1 Tax=Stieleria tagensis TaxID=2956795 RepID=UPI00209AC48F|nr:ABC transporter permease subunit [Stieleria tagensis]MCO8124798.1 ABC transporter permease [Stieleria tagensis]
MDRVLINSYLKQATFLFWPLAAALFAFAWVRVWVVSLLDMGQFQTILEQFRDFEKFAPVSFDTLFTYQGRVGMTYDEPMVILCTVIWCLSRGSDVVSGELGRGTMEMVLSQPISRAQLLWSHAVVAVGGLAALCLMVWAGIGVGITTTTIEETIPAPSVQIPIFGWQMPLPMGEPQTEAFALSERVDASMFASATFNLFAFGFFLLGLSTLLSSLDRYRWRTIGLVMAIYVLQLVMFGLGKAAESLSWLKSMSFFNCYRPQQLTELAMKPAQLSPWSLRAAMPDSMFPPLVYPGLLIVMGIVCYLAAVYLFQRRDLPAPL